MFSSRKISVILVSSIAILIHCPASPAYSPEPIFSESDAAINSREFLSHLLGDQTLTLADYNKYYTHHSEFESYEDHSYCYKNWGESLTCDENGKYVLKEESKNFMRSKHMNKSSPSLFLTRLRNILFKFGNTFSIERVEPTRLEDIWSRFKIYGKIGEKNIELSHARTELSLELGGLVNVVRIDGTKLWDIVVVNYQEMMRCN